MSDSLAVFIKGKGGNLNPLEYHHKFAADGIFKGSLKPAIGKCLCFSLKMKICQSSLSAHLRYPDSSTFVISTVIHVKQQTKTSKHLTVQGIMSYLDYIYHKYFDTLYAFWDLSKKQMSHGMGFPTMWYVRPAKPQISLHISAVSSEPLLVA